MKNNSIKNSQLIGFFNASKHAHAAEFYTRTEFKDEKSVISLITLKTKVAPAEPITLLRQKLCAALLLSRLYKVFSISLRKNIPFHFYFQLYTGLSLHGTAGFLPVVII
ncbi:hypothetical protein X975_03317, partial [Stegodyphus mimosarum]